MLGRCTRQDGEERLGIREILDGKKMGEECMKKLGVRRARGGGSTGMVNHGESRSSFINSSNA